MGMLDLLPDFCTVTSLVGRSKRTKPFQIVEVKVKIDCDGCERKIRRSVCSLKGVTSVEVNRKLSRVTVAGHVDGDKVLSAVRSTGKNADFWPYVPYNLVHYPYVPQAYDKKAPPGFVRNVPQAMAGPGSLEEEYAFIFSDENPNSCTIT